MKRFVTTNERDCFLRPPGAVRGIVGFRRAEAKIGEIRKRVRGLLRMSEALEKLAEACEGRGPTFACPILEALEGPEDAGRPDMRIKNQ